MDIKTKKKDIDIMFRFRRDKKHAANKTNMGALEKKETCILKKNTRLNSQ